MHNKLTRRTLLLTAAGALAAAAKPNLAPDDDRFLDDLSRRCFRYFWEYTDPDTGITRGRCHADGTPYAANRADIGSIAVTGFGLAGLCIAAERKWVKPAEARVRVRNTLRFFMDHAPREHGWFYHWMNVKTGERTGVLQDSKQKSELSSIDSALLLGGVLTARQYFHKDAEIHRLATAIYERMDFQWMLNGDPLLLSHGWRPEDGFIKSRWNHYSEHTILNLMAIGSPSHPIPAEAWYAWDRNQNKYGDFAFVGTSPLFTHQYSHAFVDYRGRREVRGSKVDWFANSVTATNVHRQFCIDLAKEFPGYSATMWGITSSNSEKGYKAWGGPPRNKAIDGTVVPCAAAGSLMLTPGIAVPALVAMRDKFGERIYGRYGFTDAFHPTGGWASQDVLGLDTGITLLSAENLRSGNLWKWFMGNPEITRAMESAGIAPV
jgi:hypothetical protein